VLLLDPAAMDLLLLPAKGLILPMEVELVVVLMAVEMT
jgi:hypothetical protein